MTLSHTLPTEAPRCPIAVQAVATRGVTIGWVLTDNAVNYRVSRALF
ncbi:MAG: hypothetical protein IPG47_02990 [Thermoflexaceae bacterium]|nr:hypothetical protein [Thermoflexaceae bacterium]